MCSATQFCDDDSTCCWNPITGKPFGCCPTGYTCPAQILDDKYCHKKDGNNENVFVQVKNMNIEERDIKKIEDERIDKSEFKNFEDDFKIDDSTEFLEFLKTFKNN